MQVRSFVLTLGVGMVAGATAALMLPSHNSVRKAAQKAADTVEQSVTKVANSMTN